MPLRASARAWCAWCVCLRGMRMFSLTRCRATHDRKDAESSAKRARALLSSDVESVFQTAHALVLRVDSRAFAGSCAAASEPSLMPVRSYN